MIIDEKQFEKDALIMNNKQLSEKYNVHRNTVRNLKNRLGLSKYSIIDSDEFRQDIVGGMRMHELTEKYNMSRGAIRLRMKKAKLELKQFKNENGYIELYLPDHPNASTRGYVLEHRYIMEQYIGRLLNDNEIVHHIDENKTNNDITNLQLMTRKEHMEHHKNLMKHKMKNK